MAAGVGAVAVAVAVGAVGTAVGVAGIAVAVGSGAAVGAAGVVGAGGTTVAVGSLTGGSAEQVTRATKIKIADKRPSHRPVRQCTRVIDILPANSQCVGALTSGWHDKAVGWLSSSHLSAELRKLGFLVHGIVHASTNKRNGNTAFGIRWSQFPVKSSQVPVRLNPLSLMTVFRLPASGRSIGSRNRPATHFIFTPLTGNSAKHRIMAKAMTHSVVKWPLMCRPLV